MFKKILAAVDGSPLSMKAAKQAMDLAQHHQAKLTVVYVIDQRVFFFPHEVQILAPENPYFTVLEELRNQAEKIIAKLDKEAEKRDLKFEARVLEGVVVDVLKETVEKDKFDLLVIGAYGKTGEARGIIGSTALALAHAVACSILIVR